MSSVRVPSLEFKIHCYFHTSNNSPPLGALDLGTSFKAASLLQRLLT